MLAACLVGPILGIVINNMFMGRAVPVIACAVFNFLLLEHVRPTRSTIVVT